MRSVVFVLAWATLLLASGTVTTGQERGPVERWGPPEDVVEAWRRGEGWRLPGPPEWVRETRAANRGGHPVLGPPRWVAARQRLAVELGLPGPPAQALDAWRRGEGADLPGPPDFVLELWDLGRGFQ